MRIAISSKGKNLGSEIDPVFGRCSYFIFADIKDGKVESFEAVKNGSADQTGGAGISASKTVAERGAKVVIANNIGPRALSVLQQFGIKTLSARGTVDNAIKGYSRGKLEGLR